MPIEIKEVSTRKELRKFVLLPAKIRRNYDNWVPPVYFDDMGYLNPARNFQFDTCSHIHLIAIENKEVLGRVIGLIHHEYNALNHEKTARFCWPDACDDPLITSSLMQALEEWARKQGMDKLIGPLGFSDKDPQGLQIEGFDYEPANTAPCNPPYLPQHYELLGFSKEIDLVSYCFDVPKVMPELHRRILARISANTDYRLVQFNTKRELKKYIFPIFELINTTYTGIFGFKPMTDHEIRFMVKRYFPVVDKDFVKVVMKGDELVAFVIAMPNMNAGLRKAKGRLFPLGLLHILRSARKTTQLDLMLGAIATPCRGIGLDTLMGVSLFESAIKRNMISIDSHLTMESNKLFRAEMERLDGKLVKRFRIYGKLLN